MNTTIVVVGGGYGGSALASALDDVADVVLVEPREAFVHNTAALRALVSPAWMPQMFIPYHKLLSNGRVMRERAASVVPGLVTLASGLQIAADYIVLASGSTYPFPARTDLHNTSAAQDQYRAAHEHLSAAARVLLLGAGPVGLELAGEILAEWPDKQLTIVDPHSDILTDYPEELRREVRRQLEHELFARLLLGSRLVHEPLTEPGVSRTFSARTTAGVELTADIWYRCYGVAPVTDYLARSLASARTTNGQIRVTPTLQVEGQETVFALGDLTDVAESKRAGAAMRHATVIAANIRALLRGETELTAYEPAQPAIVLTLGPRGGAGHPRPPGLRRLAPALQDNHRDTPCCPFLILREVRQHCRHVAEQTVALLAAYDRSRGLERLIGHLQGHHGVHQQIVIPARMNRRASP